MKASRSSIGTQKGFTLLEVIVTLVVAAILGTILVSFMGQGLTGSVQPLIRVQNANTLGQVLENITADYAKLNSDDVDNGTAVALSTLKTHIQNGNVSTNTPYFGVYAIAFNDYVSFTNRVQDTTDTTGSHRILKVSIQQGDQVLTTLFTR